MLYNDPALISVAAKTLEQDEVKEQLEPLDDNIVEDLSDYEKGRKVYEANHPLDQKKQHPGDEASIKDLSKKTGLSVDHVRKEYHTHGRNYAKAYDALAAHVKAKYGK